MSTGFGGTTPHHGITAGIVERFGLASLHPGLRACQLLAGDDLPLDAALVAVFSLPDWH
jgi:hypothetical protein